MVSLISNTTNFEIWYIHFDIESDKPKFQILQLSQPVI
jgi:hypothetical protein